MLHPYEMKRLVAALGFGVVSLLLLHCSKKTQREPLVHFDSPEVCELADAGPLGPDCSRDPTQPGCACDNGSPCSAGPNGYCARHGSVQGEWCQYDLCVTSKDCATGSTCVCGNLVSSEQTTSQCLASNCHVDADCGSGSYCSPSAQPPGGHCGVNPTYAGVYCHTDQDDCTDDSDCDGAQEMYCAYDLEQARWTCQAFGCAAG